jgi:hypothetical protein
MQDWEAAYRDALLESDEQKLAEKVDSAIVVLWDCLAELDLSPENLRERRRISDALLTLNMIRRVELQPGRSYDGAHTSLAPNNRPGAH